MIHAIERARERYGLDLDLSALAALESQIKAGRSLMFRRESDTAELHSVMANGKAALVLYNPKAGKIITFLPADNGTAKGQRRKRHRRRPKSHHRSGQRAKLS